MLGNLLAWGFKISETGHSVLMKLHREIIIILIIVVEDLYFSINAKQILENFKNRLSDKVDVKISGELK